MSKYCFNCGTEMSDNDKFCQKCGKEVNSTGNTKANNVNSPIVKEVNVGVAILLTIVTCGIYGIIWFVNMTDDANKVSDRPTDTSGGMAFLFSLLTCGIYSIYWSYKMGQKLFEAGKRYNKYISDNAVLYLILSIFGFGIINYALIQSDLNKFKD